MQAVLNTNRLYSKVSSLRVRTQDRFPQGNKNIKGPLIESREGPALAGGLEGHCSAKTQPGGQFGAGRRRVRGVLLVSPWATPETQGHPLSWSHLPSLPCLSVPPRLLEDRAKERPPCPCLTCRSTSEVSPVRLSVRCTLGRRYQVKEGLSIDGLLRVVLFCFFKALSLSNPSPTLGWNLQSWDQEFHAVPTEPDRCPMCLFFLNW